jgi:hypothetical protein
MCSYSIRTQQAKCEVCLATGLASHHQAAAQEHNNRIFVYRYDGDLPF